jgi:glycosyltransferase involved in cell wall biosynthesis
MVEATDRANGSATRAGGIMRPIMVVPSRSQLTAGAVWITIANWAEALEQRYGTVEIVTPAGPLTSDRARSEAFGNSSGVSSGPQPTYGRLTGHLRAFAKDLRSALRAVRFAWQQRSHSRQSGEDVPFVWQHHDLFQFAGLLIARRLDRPFVLFVDAPIVWEARSWGVARPGWGGPLERLAERPLLRRADVVLCVSAQVADASIARGAHRERVLVTPCTASVPEPAPDGRQLRRTYGIDDHFVVGWVGSFRAFHALDLLVEAVAGAPLLGTRPALLLVGDGVDRERIVGLCDERGVHVVAPGAVPHDDVFAHIAAFDCAVITAPAGQDFHYSPLKLKEYLAMGVPTIAPDVGEMRAVLRDGQDALLYPPGDVEELRARLELAASDPGRLASIGRAGRQTSVREFDIRDQLGALDTLLSSQEAR